MTPKIVGVIAVSLAAAAIAVVLIVQRNSAGRVKDNVPESEVIDKLVVDYAYRALEQLGKSAVTNCGVQLVGQEADVTARVQVDKQLFRFSKVNFKRTGWTPELSDCVNKTFEGVERNPSTDGLAFKFPEGSEYEVDVRLAFASPTLNYTD